jgi:hypothetical protein
VEASIRLVVEVFILLVTEVVVKIIILISSTILMECLSPHIIKQFKKENLPFIEFGLSKEVEQEKFITDRYGMLRKNSHYDTIDWENDEVLVEIKNRKCNYNTYATTMVGLNKIIYGMEDKRDCYFLFGFEDGSLWEWKLDKSKEYVGRTHDKFVGNGSYSTFNPKKLNYYVPLAECKQLIPPRSGCLIKVRGSTLQTP